MRCPRSRTFKMRSYQPETVKKRKGSPAIGEKTGPTRSLGCHLQFSRKKREFREKIGFCETGNRDDGIGTEACDPDDHTIHEELTSIPQNGTCRIPYRRITKQDEVMDSDNKSTRVKDRNIKMREVHQIKTRPPSFVIFGSRVDQLPVSYHRYLLNSMRRDLDLGPVPLRLTMRATKNPYDTKAE